MKIYIYKEGNILGYIYSRMPLPRVGETVLIGEDEYIVTRITHDVTKQKVQISVK